MPDVATDVLTAYQWVHQPLVQVTLPAALERPIQRAQGSLAASIDDAIGWVLREVGLMSILEQVTGTPEPLATAADTWLGQAHQLQTLMTQLRTEVSPLPETWQGPASAAFGTSLGRLVSGLDSMAADMGVAARILSDAAREAQAAQDMVEDIIREAAEWAGFTLAAGLAADIFTLGLATLATGLVESGEMAFFVARATEVSTRLGQFLEGLLNSLRELSTLRDTKGFFAARAELGRLRHGASAVRDMRAGDYANLGAHSGIGGLRGATKDVATAPLSLTGLTPQPAPTLLNDLNGPQGLHTEVGAAAAEPGPYRLPGNPNG